MSGSERRRQSAHRYGERDDVALQALTGIGIVILTSAAIAAIGFVVAAFVALAF